MTISARFVVLEALMRSGKGHPLGEFLEPVLTLSSTTPRNHEKARGVVHTASPPYLDLAIGVTFV